MIVSTMSWAQRASILLTFFALFGTYSVGQDFVRVKNGMLYLDGAPFSFIGANAYYLQQLAAQGDTTHIQEVLAVAKSCGLRCIRTWGFFDSPDSLNRATIQYQPERYNERALRALDYVLHEANLFGIKLIIPLVNNWEDFGGMNQYVQWYAALPSRRAPSPTITDHIQQSGGMSARIEGRLGRSYRVHVADGFVHDDFYRIDEIKRWYKSYIAMIVSRVNTYNGRPYKNDPTVLAWELANEPRSSERTGELVRSWVSEITSYMKSIDQNHLVATGEEGFDISQAGFQSSKYNNQSWLFDGTAGISFSKNTQDPNIDVAGIHLYAEAWRIGVSSGSTWITDHAEISKRLGKPLILGEFGVRLNKSLVYEGWLNTVINSVTSGGMVWQLVFEGLKDTDGYSVSCPRDQFVCDLLSSSAQLIRRRDAGTLTSPINSSLYQNFPNPFNAITVIRYDLDLPSRMELEVFNGLGQKVTTLFDGWRTAGRYVSLFDARDLASGVYFYRLRIGEFREAKKMIYLK